jgi:biopolymer transport protein ExbB
MSETENAAGAAEVPGWLDALTSAGINYQWAHEAVFIILYGMCVLVTFIAIERGIFLSLAHGHARRLEKALKNSVKSFEDLPPRLLRSRAPAAMALAEVRERQAHIADRGDLEEATEVAYIHARHRLHQNFWILDTVITAAPLLGLLGTILGIIETFQSLAESGISDPSAVSKGIGIALFATALGIATALYALLFHNIFHAKEMRVADVLKAVLMRISFVRPHVVVAKAA